MNNSTKLSKHIDMIESSALEIVTRIVPWLAPIPVAYTTQRAAATHYNLPPWVAFVVAVVVEGVGIGAFLLAERINHFNLTRNGEIPSIPTRGIQMLIGAYVVMVMTLTLLTDALPSLAHFSIVVFVALSFVAYKVNAIRIHHGLIERAADKVNRRASRATKKPADSGQAMQAGFATPEQAAKARDSKADKIADRRRQVSHLHAEGFDPGDIAGQVGVSAKTVRRDLAAIAEDVAGVYRNGHSDEMLAGVAT